MVNVRPQCRHHFNSNLQAVTCQLVHTDPASAVSLRRAFKGGGDFAGFKCDLNILQTIDSMGWRLANTDYMDADPFKVCI